MADTLKDIPEFFETEIGESISARTDALGKKKKRKENFKRTSLFTRFFSPLFFSHLCVRYIS